MQCFHNSSNTDLFYKKLTSDPNTDFSRYNYFYVKYLIDAGETEKAREFLNFSLTLYPRNLLLNQLKIDLIDKKIKNYYVRESVGIATGILITCLHSSGLAMLTHTPSPMVFLNKILKRPSNEKPFVLLIVELPDKKATVPKFAKHKKKFEEITSIF